MNRSKYTAPRSIHPAIKSAFAALLRSFCRIAGGCLALVIAFSLLFSKLPKAQDLLAFERADSISETVIYEQLAAISEFAVYEYTYTNHVEHTNTASLLGHDVLGTDNWFAFDYTGAIKIGCDFQDIKMESIDHQSRTIVLKLPEMALLSNDIHIDMDTYRDRNNLCNPLMPADVLEYLYARREPEFERARGLGVFNLAVINAESIITTALKGFGYEIRFI